MESEPPNPEDLPDRVRSQSDNEVDDFTGLSTDSVEESAYRKDVVALINQSEAFQQMTSTRGWKLLEKFIATQVQWMTELLKTELDFSRIRRLQAEIIAFESLTKIIDTSFVNADQARKQLMDVVSGEA